MLMLLLPFPDGDRGRVVEHLAVAVPVIMEASGSSSLIATPKHEIIRDNFCAKQLNFATYLSRIKGRQSIPVDVRGRRGRVGDGAAEAQPAAFLEVQVVGEALVDAGAGV